MTLKTRMGPRVVIAGGGFGGLYAALYLARSPDRPRGMRITLIDRNNFFTFTPLLTEVAGGALGPEHVTQPYRVFAAANDFEFLQARVDAVDTADRLVMTQAAPVPYDFLIFALGGEPRYFGNEEIERAALPFQTLRHALALRNRFIGLLERLQRTAEREERERMMSFVVTGAGPAGTEVASELRHLMCEVAPRFYSIDVPVRITLIDAGAEILPQFEPDLARAGRLALERRGIEVCTGLRVSGYRDGAVLLSDGRSLNAGTLIWTAGMQASRVGSGSGLLHDGSGSLHVDRYLRVEGYPEIYAIGDTATLVNPRTARPYPNVAPIAINQGMRAAANIENAIVGRAQEAYEAHYAGKIVSLGAGEALAETLGFRWSGAPAWWMYRLVYLLKLVGARPKIRLAVTLALNRLLHPDLSYHAGGEDGLPRD